MIGRINIFYLFWAILVVVLLLFSVRFENQSNAIVAVVEPQRVAVSFRKPIKLNEIHVIPGQEVKEGDLLLEAERPALLLEIDNTQTKLRSLESKRLQILQNTESEIALIKDKLAAGLKSLDYQINEIVNRQKINQAKIQSIKSLQGYKADPSNRSPLDLQHEALHQEKRLLQGRFNIEMQSLVRSLELENQILDSQVRQLNRELQVLEAEKEDLNRYSPISGTIGNVYSQINELVSPFSTIISIYEKNPTIIKAYLNEENSFNMQTGDQVIVESLNRPYSIVGNVIEIGSRIVNYPNRLLSNQFIELWGQEMFIKIPAENNFLNGERVFVRTM